jgi:hypothetical protein
MSIIYDALKKVEVSGSTDTKKDPGKNSKPKTKIYLIYALTICFGLFIANTFYGWLSQKVLSETNAPSKRNNQKANKNELAPVLIPLEQAAIPKGEIPQVKTPEEAREQFSLSGVFFSGNDGYALINNMIVKTGDKIGGATVEKISLEEVDLKVGESTVKLTNNATNK